MKRLRCTRCERKLCYEGKDCGLGTGTASSFYSSEDDRVLHQAAARVEAEGYGRLCRIEEIVRFCELLGMEHLGVAFCIGLSEEAARLDELLGSRFRISSVCCKLCPTSKDDLGLPKIIEDRYESACNPMEQARLLNEAGTELNLALGLCLGHDILFARHSNAPVTTLIVKDRVLGHNPVVALYCSYHMKRLRQGL